MASYEGEYMKCGRSKWRAAYQALCVISAKLGASCGNISWPEIVFYIVEAEYVVAYAGMLSLADNVSGAFGMWQCCQSSWVATRFVSATAAIVAIMRQASAAVHRRAGGAAAS